MGKRRRDDGAYSNGPRKAPRKENIEDYPPPATITSLRDLRDHIHFRQDDTEALRSGHWAVKAFLDSIVHDNSENASSVVAPKLVVLKEYLDAEPTDLVQAWSYAAQTDNDRLAIAVTSNIALLLKTLSSSLELRTHGLAFGRSLLQREQLKSLSRGLTAESHKEAIISPCLRILTELVCFDGGALAGAVYRHQDLIFNTKFLDRNLRLGKANEDDRRHSSVRSNTMRYILSHIRYQDTENLLHIVDTRSIFRNMLENLRNDPSWLFEETIQTVETVILRSRDVPRRFKSAIISDKVLISVVEAMRMTDDTALLDLGWGFVRKICTEPEYGVLLPSSWYPATNEKRDEDYITIADDDQLPPHIIRNTILSRFLQQLKPHVLIVERQVLLSTFEASPELVADYMRQAASRLQMQPKLTNTWIGYSSLLFSITSLDVPDFFGATAGFRHDPPPTVNVVENIIPQSLTREVLRKCLTQQSELIAFFAVRLMIIALLKLERVCDMIGQAAIDNEAYDDASFELRTAAFERVPLLRDVVDASRSTAESNVLLKEAYTHLIALYSSSFPDEATKVAYDAAGQLATTLTMLQSTDLDDESRDFVSQQLIHLIDIADRSQGMRWLQKQSGLQLSPLLTLIRLFTTRPRSGQHSQLETLAAKVLFSAGILQSTTISSAAGAFFASLDVASEIADDLDTWTFLDDCLHRLDKAPIKYLDDLDALADASGSKALISLLLIVVAEQLPYKLGPAKKGPALTWASRFASVLQSIGEDKQIIKRIQKELKGQGITLKTNVEVRHKRPGPGSVAVSEKESAHSRPVTLPKKGVEIDFTTPLAESDKHPELIRYKRQELDELVESDTLSKLMLCLCSRFPEIRKQAMLALSELLPRIKDSSLEYKEQLWLLVGELVETATLIIDDQPLSYIAGAFARAALKVLLDATHAMFPLVNRYLVKDPYWNVKKLPGYFLDKTLLAAPEELEGFWSRLEWVLELLLDGVRVAEDVRPLRFRDGLERILSITASPGVTVKAHALVLQLVYRIIVAEGSAGLLLNAGLEAWLQQSVHRARFTASSLQVLDDAIVAQQDTERISRWKGIATGNALEPAGQITAATLDGLTGA